MTQRKRDLDPAIRRGRLPSIDIYEVTASELEVLERGSPDSIYLNLSIASLSTGISFFVSLLTATIANLFLFCAFLVICLVCLLAGVTYLLLWWKSANSLQEVVREIRSRLPPKGEQETGPIANDTVEQ